MICDFAFKRGRNLMPLGKGFADRPSFQGITLIGKVTSLAQAAGPVAHTGYWDSNCEPVQYVKMRITNIGTVHVASAAHFRGK